MLIHLAALVSLMFSLVQGQLLSPCPDVFKYEPLKPEQPDRWYGNINVRTNEELEGVYLKITLDRKADILGNWFGDTSSSDNKLFYIKNPQYKLEVGPPILVRFFVKYNVGSVIPTVQKILLNGKTICPSPADKSEPTLHISVNSNNKTSENSNDGDDTRKTTPKVPWFVSLNVESPEITPLSTIALSNQSPVEHLNDLFQGDFPFRQSNKRPTSSTTKRPISGPVQCGTVAQHPTPLINYGQRTAAGQWPWHTALYILQGAELKYTCGGTLISDRHVVTAAHCVTKPKTRTPAKKDALVMYFGKYNLVSFGKEVQDKQIESITVHPEYNSSFYFNDIALVTLESSVEMNDFVRPCCLWDEGDTDIEKVVGQPGTVVGWGLNEHGQLSKDLMQVQLPVVSTTACFLSNRQFFSQFIFEKNFCAGFRNDTSVCNGDSGGGMVFPKQGTSGQNTVWQLRGIISLGVAMQSEAICDPKQYSILTDAAKYVKWIKESMRN